MVASFAQFLICSRMRCTGESILLLTHMHCNNARLIVCPLACTESALQAEKLRRLTEFNSHEFKYA